MNIDGITLSVIVTELKMLSEAKIERIYQPLRDEITMYLHSKEGKKCLTLSASASDCRIHLSTNNRSNPEKAPNFCMVLRKYLSGGRIAEIKQIGLDRIVYIYIDAKDDMGVSCRYTLIIEMMGKYSNIILNNQEGRILDSIKHVSMDISSKRQILPGLKYTLPPSEKYNPLTTDLNTLAKLLSAQELPTALVTYLEGISPQTAIQLCGEYYKDMSPKFLSDNDAYSFSQYIQERIFKILEHPKPCLQKNMQGKPVFFSAIPYAAYTEEGREYFETANALIDHFYALRIFGTLFKGRQDSLLRILHKQINRLEKNVKIHLETIQGRKKADKFLLYGELISANLYQLKRGTAEAEVLNYYTNEIIKIPLDPSISPAQNASKFFKKASKMKHGANIAKEHYEKDYAELTYLNSLEFDTLSASNLEDLDAVRSELVRFGYLSLAPKEKIKREDPLARPRKFLTQNGYTVLAGRNSRQNDILTMRIAQENDYWFHAKNTPGSHVLLFTQGTQPPEIDLFQAATIAASLCRAKNSGKLAVDYVLRKHIWKANGAKPGMVLYDSYRTLVVEPNPELVNNLEQTVSKV